MKSKKVVYLCGPIHECTDREARDWREFMTNCLVSSFDILDPMRRDSRGQAHIMSVAEAVVEGDLQDLRDADIMVRFWPRASDGAAMEQFYMYRDLGKVVVLIVPDGCKPSPWTLLHATAIVKSEREAVDYIKSLPRF